MTRAGVARRGAVLGALLMASLGLVGCSHSPSRAGPTAASSPAPHREVLVTIGSAATFGIGLDSPLRDGWPQRLYREAFARSTVFVNMSFPDVTVDEARAMQLPIALQVHATVVTVWLGDGDLSAHHSAGTFEADLDALVARLRTAGARVLIGNLSRARPGAAEYDDAIARVARARGATVVDVAAAFPDIPSFGPDSAVTPTTSARIAQVFAAALARS